MAVSRIKPTALKSMFNPLLLETSWRLAPFWFCWFGFGRGKNRKQGSKGSSQILGGLPHPNQSTLCGTSAVGANLQNRAPGHAKCRKCSGLPDGLGVHHARHTSSAQKSLAERRLAPLCFPGISDHQPHLHHTNLMSQKAPVAWSTD